MSTLRCLLENFFKCTSSELLMSLLPGRLQTLNGIYLLDWGYRRSNKSLLPENTAITTFISLHVFISWPVSCYHTVVLKLYNVICKMLWRVTRFWSWCCSSSWCIFLKIRKIEECPFSGKKGAIVKLSLGWGAQHMRTLPFTARGLDCHPDSRWHPAHHLTSQGLSWENGTFWMASCAFFRFQGNISISCFILLASQC